MAQIFSGRTANWRQVHGWDIDGKEINGPDAPIHLHALDTRSDSYGFFKSAVLAPAAVSLDPSATRHETSKELSRKVGADVGAIGFAAFPYISKNDALIIRTKCGLLSEASRFSIKTEQYPLARRLYLYTAGEPRRQAAREFLQFVLSDEAQPVIRGAGFVDQSVEYQDMAEQRRWFAAFLSDPADGLDAKEKSALKKKAKTLAANFVEAIRDKRRTSIVLRFETNSSELDARALQDSERLARRLNAKNTIKSGETFFELIGFADSVGNFAHNRKLSKQRADQVLNRLKQLGVTPAKTTAETISSVAGDEDASEEDKQLLKKILGDLKQQGAILSTEGPTAGLSSLAPAACNDTEEGRAKNRRVEAWVSDYGAK
jgi:phosphate transport system substrate-binding protein